VGRDERGEGMGGEESDGEGRKEHQEREGGRNGSKGGRKTIGVGSGGRGGPGHLTVLERRPEYCWCPLTFHAFLCHRNPSVFR